MDSDLIKNLVPFIWYKNMDDIDIALARLLCGAKGAREIFQLSDSEE